jgi:ParB/RepB/Spo0J family partition protein
VLIPLSSIEVLPDRQRADYGDIAGLAASIKRLGQLQPVVVTATGSEPPWRLLAGGRRHRAIETLGRSEILAVTLDSLPPDEQELVELEENVRRKDLEWPEYVAAVARFVTLTAKPQREIAEDLQVHESTISKIMQLHPALEAKPALRTASSWKSAYDLLSADTRKAQASVMEDALSIVADLALPSSPTQGKQPEVDFGPIPIAPPPAPEFAQVGSFLDWAPAYSGRRFNLIHCDFPYGLNMDSANLQGSSDRWNTGLEGRYDDSPELFDALVRAFFDNQDRFIADSAHCIFWLAHRNVGKIMSRFRHYNWTACEVPLIWHKSDGAGIAPDVRRQPRRTYEIAVFATRGDRPISKVKAASVASPTTKLHHLSEKPLAVVTHFLEMITDGYTELLDPTCGSGTACEAALRLGATRVLGLDVKPEHVAHTNRRCAQVGAVPTPGSIDSIIADL